MAEPSIGMSTVPVDGDLVLVSFGREVCGDLQAGLRREWLVSNGLGGYASGTVAGVATGHRATARWRGDPCLRRRRAFPPAGRCRAVRAGRRLVLELPSPCGDRPRARRSL